MERSDDERNAESRAVLGPWNARFLVRQRMTNS